MKTVPPCRLLVGALTLLVVAGGAPGQGPTDMVAALLGMPADAPAAHVGGRLLAAAEGPGDPADAAAPDPTDWVWFSDAGRAFSPLLADQREAQIRGGFAAARHGDILGDVALGGDIALIRRDGSASEADSLTVRGLFTARFHMNSESSNQLNTDYVGGLAYGCRRGRMAWEVFVYHQSSHLGDETLVFNKRLRIDYGKETVRFLWSCDVADGLRIYGGPSFNFSGEPFLRYRTTAQAGCEYRFMRWGRPMYVAADVQAREINNWRPGINAQVGMDLGDPKKVARRPRLFAEVYTGYSHMGQFFNVYETSFLIGIGFNW